MDNIYVLAFLFVFHFSPGETYETHCSSGERVHTPREGNDVCIPCSHGTFIAEEYHFFRKCNPCTRIENPDVEVLVSACNSTHDAVIRCTHGFYRRRARNIRQKDKCHKCTECPFPARPCEGYYNTVCCPPNHDAVMTPDGVFVCKERPIVCGDGQFFRTSSEECLPCPAGTFMSDHSHTYKDCLTCEELSENNLTQAVITRPCSRTAPTLFGCKVGYFRDPTQESLQIEVPCTPCRICNRSLVDCGMFHDAVCDDEERMVSTVATDLTVSIDTTDGVDMIKQLIATFNGSVNSCRRHCMEDGFATLEDNIAQLEFSKCTTDGVDMIKQLIGTFNGSVNSCRRHCMEDGFATLEDNIAQLEFSKCKSLSSCFPGIHISSIVYAWLFVICGTGFLCIGSLLIWLMKFVLGEKNYRQENLISRLFIIVVFFLNVVSSVSLIFYAVIETRGIEENGCVAIASRICCCVVVILNIVLVVGKILFISRN